MNAVFELSSLVTNKSYSTKPNMQEKGPINKTLCLHIRFCRSDEKAVIVMFIAMFQLFWSKERYFREYESFV